MLSTFALLVKLHIDTAVTLTFDLLTSKLLYHLLLTWITCQSL